MTAVLREFDIGHRAYATGARASGSSELDRIRVEWPTWCQRMGLARQVTATEFEVPPLLGFRRIGAMEVWQIGLPGRFGDPGERSPRAMLPGFFQSSRRGAAAHGFEIRPGVLEVVVSRSQLPDVLRFDPARIPVARHRVWLGQSIDGSDVLWDLQVEPHGLVAGQTGSGKSKTVESVLTQFAVKGWVLIIVTPKLNDPILAGFAHGPHTVITGIGDDALELVAEMYRSERAERTERQKIQAEYGVEWWHQVPPDVLAERPLKLLVKDESRSFLIQHRGESDHRRTLKAEILHAWNEWVQEGRSAGHHGLIVSQSIAVEGLGGGFVDDQLGMRLAVRRLSRKWHPVMFPETDSDAPSLLVNPATPPGRAVARGLVAPGTVFGSDAVNDAPMQVPLLDAATRDGLLSGDIPWGPDAPARPTTPGDDDGPVPAPAADRPRSGWAVPLTVAVVWLVVVLVLVVSLVLEVRS